MGAEVLLFPTAIGSEPGCAELDSRDHWQIAMRGHAAANLLPVVAANRVGEAVAASDVSLSMRFYGSSFICDHKGAMLSEADRDNTASACTTWPPPANYSRPYARTCASSSRSR